MTFFLRTVDAQIEFEAIPNGEVTQLRMHQGGALWQAKKLTSDGK